jgi:hypothetical protein
VTPLNRAYICVDCEMIDGNAAYCPACGSGAVWPLRRWLDRATSKVDEMAKQLIESAVKR